MIVESYNARIPMTKVGEQAAKQFKNPSFASSDVAAPPHLTTCCDGRRSRRRQG
jgi:hypothetical protein